MVDGIDGSGKRTIVEAMVEHFAEQGKRIFDIGEWSKIHHVLPTIDDMKDAEVVIGVEPSYVWTGAAIRYELIRNGQGHAMREITQAFAIDRQILYRRCYLPILERGGILITERGVSTSIVYNPAMDETVTLADVLVLEGNELAMQHAPDHLVIASLHPSIAMERLGARASKKDDAIFEKEAFLHTTHERYHSDWFKKLFEDRGTKVHHLDTSPSMTDVKRAAKNLISTF